MNVEKEYPFLILSCLECLLKFGIKELLEDEDGDGVKKGPKFRHLDCPTQPDDQSRKRET